MLWHSSYTLYLGIYVISFVVFLDCAHQSRTTRFELAAFGVTSQYSNHLSYVLYSINPFFNTKRFCLCCAFLYSVFIERKCFMEKVFLDCYIPFFLKTFSIKHIYMNTCLHFNYKGLQVFITWRKRIFNTWYFSKSMKRRWRW